MTRRPFYATCFGVALVVMSATASAAEPGRFVQKDFCISMWVAPPADDHVADYYRQMAEANFNVVMYPREVKTLEQAKWHADLFEKLGMKVIFAVGPEATGPQLDHPACLGYGLKDEPPVSMFPTLAKSVADIRAKRPGKLVYVNLYPDYAVPRQLGVETYEEYVRRFLDELKVDVLCFDYYPKMKPDQDTRDGYCKNLDLIRRYALKAGIPFWNFFNIMPFGGHFDPTEAQVLWQINTSLAYGAKGVLYFCYWTPPGRAFPKGGAIITMEGRPTRHYDQARRINARLKRLGPTLMKLTSTKVIRIEPGENAAELLAGTPLKSLTDGDYLVGVFAHADGRRAVLLNNYRFAYTAWPTVEFVADADKVVEIDPHTGQEVPLRDDSPAMDGLQISLDAADGRLFIVGQ